MAILTLNLRSGRAVLIDVLDSGKDAIDQRLWAILGGNPQNESVVKINWYTFKAEALEGFYWGKPL